MKILYLTHHWGNNSHHSEYSGFQRLAVFAAKNHEVTVVTWGHIETEYIDKNGIKVIEIKARDRDYLFLKRFKISLRGQRISNNYQVIHALYSDCTFFLQKDQFILTLHVLPGVVKYSNLYQKLFIQLKYILIQKRALKRAKAITCVSLNIFKLLEKNIKTKSSFIPHGIDVEYWKPNEKLLYANKYEEFFLCVGSHGVDFPLLNKLIEMNRSFHFVVVGMGGLISIGTNVTHLTNISDIDLKTLYMNCKAVVRPLTFATANNSILEGLSMGKKIITTRISGISDYLNEEICIFTDQFQNFKIDLQDKLDAESIRKYAIDNFSWDSLLPLYVQLYNSELI